MKKKVGAKLFVAVLALVLSIVFLLDTCGVIFKGSSYWYVYVFSFLTCIFLLGGFYYKNMFYFFGKDISITICLTMLIIDLTKLTYKNLWPLFFVFIGTSLVMSILIVKKWKRYFEMGLAILLVSSCTLTVTILGKYQYIIGIALVLIALIYLVILVKDNFSEIKEFGQKEDYYVRPSKENNNKE